LTSGPIVRVYRGRSEIIRNETLDKPDLILPRAWSTVVNSQGAVRSGGMVERTRRRECFLRHPRFRDSSDDVDCTEHPVGPPRFIASSTIFSHKFNKRNGPSDTSIGSLKRVWDYYHVPLAMLTLGTPLASRPRPPDPRLEHKRAASDGGRVSPWQLRQQTSLSDESSI